MADERTRRPDETQTRWADDPHTPWAESRRTRWTDDRLDDRFRAIEDRVTDVAGLPVVVATVVAELAGARADIHKLGTNVSGLGRALWSLLAGLLLVSVAAILGVVILL